jgi:hypothetical protein
MKVLAVIALLACGVPAWGFLRSRTQTSLEATLNTESAISAKVANPSSMDEHAKKMSLEEAMTHVGHLLPEEVSLLLAKARDDAMHGRHSDSQTPILSAAIQNIVDKLNEMYLATFRDMDLTFIDCESTKNTMRRRMLALKADEAVETADLSTDLSDLSFWNGKKIEATKEIQKLTEMRAQHNALCDRITRETLAQISILKNDFNVSSNVLADTDCMKADKTKPPEVAAKVPTWEDIKKGYTASLVQVKAQNRDLLGDELSTYDANADVNSEHYAERAFDSKHTGWAPSTDPADQATNGKMVLLECIAADGEAFFTFEDRRTAAAILQLSAGSQKRVQQAFLQMGLVHTRQAPSNTTTRAVPAGNPQDPAAAQIPKDMKGAQCNIAKSPMCPKIVDALSLLVNEIKNELTIQQNYLTAVTKNCTKVLTQINNDIESWNRELRMSNTRISQLNGRIASLRVDLDETRKTFSLQLASYVKKDAECNTALEEGFNTICGVKKIKGELTKMSGLPDMIQDCTVAPWKWGSCSVPCNAEAGGMQKLTRAIVAGASPDKIGAPCPALEAVTVCNKFECPVDCQVSSFSEWTRCSAKCGVGDKMRFREVSKEPEWGGKPCAARQEVSVCSQDACDKDCILGDWSAWSPCSQACGFGFKNRERPIKTKAVGQGFCPSGTDPRKFERQACNTQACPSTKPVCQAKVDIVILVDASGSLGWSGWEATKNFTVNFIEQTMMDENKGVQVGIVKFSSDITDVAPLNGDKAWTLSRAKNMRWDGWLTATASALARAETILTNGGRAGAPPIVIVVTDGMPTGVLPKMMEYTNTAPAARSLRRKARVVFVGVGPALTGQSETLMRSWASEGGNNNNYAKVNAYDKLVQAVDSIMVGTCPEIQDLRQVKLAGPNGFSLTQTDEAVFSKPAVYHPQGFYWGDELAQSGERLLIDDGSEDEYDRFGE